MTPASRLKSSTSTCTTSIHQLQLIKFVPPPALSMSFPLPVGSGPPHSNLVIFKFANSKSLAQPEFGYGSQTSSHGSTPAHPLLLRTCYPVRMEPHNLGFQQRHHHALVEQGKFKLDRRSSLLSNEATAMLSVLKKLGFIFWKFQ